MDDFDFAEKILEKKSSSTVYLSDNVAVLDNKNVYTPKRRSRSLIGFDENTGKVIF